MAARVCSKAMSLSYFALLLKPHFTYAAARMVRADEHVINEGAHVFRREGEEVFRIPSTYVHEVLGCTSHKEASDHVRRVQEARAGAGAASAHITEAGTAPRLHPSVRRGSAAGSVTEGVSVRVKE